MLAAIAFVLFLIALILKIVGTHADWIQWLLIIGALVLAGAVVFVDRWPGPWRHA